ncbi:MAG TPA: transposase [Gemmatimonadaceae bacterium]|nr:transposase [Gemmatimonadaceae bacterium]
MAPTTERIGSPRTRGGNPKTLQELGEPENHSLGRSRGWFSTEVHLVTDGSGLRLGAELSGGQAHDNRFVETVLASVGLQRVHPGSPRSQPRRPAGDRGCSFPTVRASLRRRHSGAVIAERSDQRERRAHHAGRKPTFDNEAYRRQRHFIENCVGWLTEARGIATRYEQLALYDLALVILAMARCLSKRIITPPSRRA